MRLPTLSVASLVCDPMMVAIERKWTHSGHLKSVLWAFDNTEVLTSFKGTAIRKCLIGRFCNYSEENRGITRDTKHILV